MSNEKYITTDQNADFTLEHNGSYFMDFECDPFVGNSVEAYDLFMAFKEQITEQLKSRGHDIWNVRLEYPHEPLDPAQIGRPEFIGEGDNQYRAVYYDFIRIYFTVSSPPLAIIIGVIVVGLIIMNITGVFKGIGKMVGDVGSGLTIPLIIIAIIALIVLVLPKLIKGKG